MSFIVEEKIDAYAEQHSTPPDPLLTELAEETKATMSAPQMLTGPIEGRFLELLVHASGAKRVLEIGTFTGYSALSMAAALPEGGHIDTLDIEPKHAEVAQRYFDRSPHGSKITLHLGPASETIAKLEGEFDLVFIDADKEGYPDYLQKLAPLVRPGGLIVAHNMASPPPDPRYVEAVTTNPAFDTVFLNMHSAGVGVTLKKR